MSTTEDFENAPIGSTATAPNGDVALNTGRFAFDWAVYNSSGGFHALLRSDELKGFTIDPTHPAPTTAQEALDLAWNLAHPLKEGQGIPTGTRYVSRSGGGDLATFTAGMGWTPTPSNVKNVRTFDPLPDPEPDWLDAPAVLATCLECNGDGLVNSVHVNFIGERWACTECHRTLPWIELTDVTPLYPKGQDK